MQIFLLTAGGRPSLRANGWANARPMMTPKSSIHSAASGGDGLRRRYAPRNDRKPFWFLGVNSGRKLISFCDGDAARGLSSGTSLERNAPESLTPSRLPDSFTATSRAEAIRAALDQASAGSTSGGVRA